MSTRHPTSTPDERELAIEAAAISVQRGLLAIIPTDTVYGIAADAFDEDAVRDLLLAKGRGRAMPPPVLVSSTTTLDALAVKVPSWARDLVKEFWPGALTLVCRAQSSLQWDLGDTRGTVAIRMPDHEFTLEVIERTGPLAVSSANLTGRPAATTADQADKMLGDSVEVLVDDGPSPSGLSSTILDITRSPGRLLREGAITREALNVILEPLGFAIAEFGTAPDTPAGDEPRPGSDQGPTSSSDEQSDEQSDEKSAGTADEESGEKSDDAPDQPRDQPGDPSSDA